MSDADSAGTWSGPGRCLPVVSHHRAIIVAMAEIACF